MTKEQIEKGNNLVRQITELRQALNCFEIDFEDGKGFQSTNPKLFIEFDDVQNEGDRSLIPFPIVLSDKFIDTLKGTIKSNIIMRERDFEQL